MNVNPGLSYELLPHSRNNGKIVNNVWWGDVETIEYLPVTWKNYSLSIKLILQEFLSGLHRRRQEGLSKESFAYRQLSRKIYIFTS